MEKEIMDVKDWKDRSMEQLQSTQKAWHFTTRNLWFRHPIHHNVALIIDNNSFHEGSRYYTYSHPIATPSPCIVFHFFLKEEFGFYREVQQYHIRIFEYKKVEYLGFHLPSVRNKTYPTKAAFERAIDYFRTQREETKDTEHPIDFEVMINSICNFQFESKSWSICRKNNFWRKIK